MGSKLDPNVHTTWRKLATTQEFSQLPRYNLTIAFAGPALDDLHADRISLQPSHSNPSQEAFTLKQAIKLSQTKSRHLNVPLPALNNLSLTITAKSTMGLVWATGSGKSTPVDLILGMLEAQEGPLAADGQAITEHNPRAWQHTIRGVPQQIYFTEDTDASNIAFGLDAKDIDQAAVERTTKISNLHDLVVNKLPQKYQTTAG